MPFKIVQTVEKGELCLCVVPSRWEQDGVLHWPKKTALARLCQDESSSPFPNWDKMDCVLKRELPTYSAAQKEMDRMESITDTEMEDSETPPPKATKVRRRILEKKSCGVAKDFNKFLPEVSDVDESKMAGDPTGLGAQEDENATEEPTSYPDCSANPGVEEKQPTSTEEQPKAEFNIEEIEVDDVIPEATMEAIAANQVVIYNNQLKIIATLAQLLTAVGVLNNKVISQQVGPSAPVDKKPFEAMRSREDLDLLENELRDDARMNHYVQKLSAVCGTSGKSNGVDSAYRLIDSVASRELIHMCSWTGMAKETSEGNQPSSSMDADSSASKIPLKFYVRFRTLFLRVIKLADNDFSEAACDKFLKSIMKNSKQRLISKVQSTGKNRPKNLSYKKDKESEQPK